MDLMKVVDQEFASQTELPKFSAGDTITVHYKIKEGNKERVQQYRGVVIQRRGKGHTETFTVRKMSGNIGVERIFPSSSPFIGRRCVFGDAEGLGSGTGMQVTHL